MKGLQAIIRAKSLWLKQPIKRLTISFRHTAGRNNLGKLVWLSRSKVFSKQRYRFINNFKIQMCSWFLIARIEYDPMRGVWLALLLNITLGMQYILASRSMFLGLQFIMQNKYLDILTFKSVLRPGILPLYFVLAKLSLGVSIYGLESWIGSGMKYVRAAGVSAQLLRHMLKWVHIRLPSGEIRLYKKNLVVLKGVLSNKDRFLNKLIKAGQTRYLGIKPTVRGVAKNPIDHPHGGGQGHTSPPVGARTPWGKLTKDVRTTQRKIDWVVIRTRRGVWLSKQRRRVIRSRIRKI